MRLQNKTAIVTGAGQGIGFGIALRLAEEGCNIIISELNPVTCENAVSEIKKLGVKCIGVSGNISKSEDVLKLFEIVSNEFGKVDILINNAGVYPFTNFETMSEDDWEKVMNVNLKGIFLVTKNFLKIMNEGGKIVNISSIASFIGFEGLVHYCTSKSGVNGFTRALALELAKRKINVNAIAPGAIETPGAKMSEETKKQTISGIPIGRIGTPKDIANAVLFLSSNESDYITGQIIIVDGGWTVK